MAAQRKKPRATKRPSRRAAVKGSGQVRQLRTALKQMRGRLAKEAKRRRLDLRMLGEAKKARARVLKQVTRLRQEGRKIAGQFKRALTDARSREKARTDALARLAEVREELRTRTGELRKKSAELELLRAQGSAAAEPPQAPISNQGSEPEEDPTSL